MKRIVLFTLLLSIVKLTHAENIVSAWDFYVNYIACQEEGTGRLDSEYNNHRYYNTYSEAVHLSIMMKFGAISGYLNLNDDYNSSNSINGSTKRKKEISGPVNVAYIPGYVSITSDKLAITTSNNQRVNYYGVKIPKFQIIEQVGSKVKFRPVDASYTSDPEKLVFPWTFPWEKFYWDGEGNITFRVNGELTLKKMNQIKDIYGDWEWNNERTIIYIFPKNKNNDAPILVILNNNGKLSLNLDFPQDTPMESTANGISFIKTSLLLKDYTTPLDLTFTKVDKGNESEMVMTDTMFKNLWSLGSYDRFTNKLADNSESIIEQLSTQKDIIISYMSASNKSYTFVYHIEGLENILDKIR